MDTPFTIECIKEAVAAAWAEEKAQEDYERRYNAAVEAVVARSLPVNRKGLLDQIAHSVVSGGKVVEYTISATGDSEPASVCSEARYRIAQKICDELNTAASRTVAFSHADGNFTVYTSYF